MVGKKSKSVALDSRDLNPLFSLMKGYGPLMALAIIAVLTVCAAFFIYRSAKGQRKRNGEKSVMETEEENETNPKKRRVEKKHVQSTGNVDDAQKAISVDPCKIVPVTCTVESSNYSSRSHEEDQEEEDEKCAQPLSETCAYVPGGQKCLSNHTTVQNGSWASQTSCEDFLDQPEAVDGGQEDAGEQGEMEGSDEDLTVGKESQEGFRDEKLHTAVNESWEDLSGCFGKVCLKMGSSDLSEKETGDESSAQNISCTDDSAYEDGESEAEKSCGSQNQSSSTVDQNLKYYQQGNHYSPVGESAGDNVFEDKSRTHEDLTWVTQTVGITSKGPGDLMVDRQCEQEMALLHLYKPNPGYLSFSPEAFTGMMGGSNVMKDIDVSPVAPPQKQSNSGDVQVEDRSDKTEINIMEATMDNNEWLNGNESHSDCPWLSLSDGGESSSVAEESQQDVEWDTEKSEASEETSVAYASSDDDDPAVKRVATVPPMIQTVRVTFSVHYITEAPKQLLAVTGNQQELGGWQSFVPLQRNKNGYWANTVPLPVEGQVEWKFVLVEDGRICRWEECGNRLLLLTGQEEDLHVQGWWGCL